MKVVIFGCGRTGATLGLQLATRGHHVTIVEQNQAAIHRLGNNHRCEIVIGSGLDDDTLERAGIKEADAFFALTRGDNTNLMSAQVVRIKYNVPRICVKVADPLRAEAYRKLGYFCITPSALSAGMMREWICEDPYQSIDTYNNLPKEMEI